MDSDAFAMIVGAKGSGYGYAMEIGGHTGKGSRISGAPELLAVELVPQDSFVHALLDADHETDRGVARRDWIFDASETVQSKILDPIGVGRFSGVDGICI